MNLSLSLIRQPSANGCTIGQLSINGKPFCYTLEDVVRPAGQVVADQTAIPAGTYPVTLTVSPRLHILTPRLGGAVAGRGVLLHTGNTAADTRGCILVGFAKMPSNVKIYQSREAFEALMPRLRAVRHFVAAYTDANGRSKLVGTPEFPLRLTAGLETGKRPGDRNGYPLVLAGTTPRPAPFYLTLPLVAPPTRRAFSPGFSFGFK